jgi:GNAT superfamily N-acetyltransferase
MLSIRPALPADMPVVSMLIHELAEFEHLPAVVTEANLLRDGFCEPPKFRALVAEWDGKLAGYALFFGCYFTFDGRDGLFLEDLYVRDQYRGKGIGKALLARVASIAHQQNCLGVRWHVLDWNASAIEFYKGLGATLLNELKLVSLDGDALVRVAEGSK